MLKSDIQGLNQPGQRFGQPDSEPELELELESDSQGSEKHKQNVYGDNGLKRHYLSLLKRY